MPNKLTVLILFIFIGCGQTSSMQLTSPHFQSNQTIPSQFTCEGEDISPALAWSDMPAGTQSFVLIVRDPDAPSGEFIHWMVKDIPVATTSVENNAVPAGGVEVANDFGKTSWGGPCPPSGVHRYYFQIYALDVPNTAGESLAEIEQNMTDHILAKGELMGTFSR